MRNRRSTHFMDSRNNNKKVLLKQRRGEARGIKLKTNSLVAWSSTGLRIRNGTDNKVICIYHSHSEASSMRLLHQLQLTSSNQTSLTAHQQSRRPHAGAADAPRLNNDQYGAQVSEEVVGMKHLHRELGVTTDLKINTFGCIKLAQVNGTGFTDNHYQS